MREVARRSTYAGVQHFRGSLLAGCTALLAVLFGMVVNGWQLASDRAPYHLAAWVIRKPYVVGKQYRCAEIVGVSPHSYYIYVRPRGHGEMWICIGHGVMRAGVCEGVADALKRNSRTPDALPCGYTESEGLEDTPEAMRMLFEDIANHSGVLGIP